VVRRPRGEPVGGGRVRGEVLVENLVRHRALGAVGEYDEVRADRVAGGEFDDVSGVVAFGRDSGVGVDAADRHARAVLGAGVFSAVAEPVVEAGAVEGVAELVVRGVDSGACERRRLVRTAELRAVQLALDDPVVELVGVDPHDVDPVVEDASGIGRIRTEPVAVGTGNPLFEHERVGAVGRGRVRCGGSGRTATHDRDVYAFHIP